MIKKKSPLREIFLLVGFYDFTTLLSALSPLIGEKGFEEQLSELWTVDSLWSVVCERLSAEVNRKVEQLV